MMAKRSTSSPNDASQYRPATLGRADHPVGTDREPALIESRRAERHDPGCRRPWRRWAIENEKDSAATWPTTRRPRPDRRDVAATSVCVGERRRGRDSITSEPRRTPSGQPADASAQTAAQIPQSSSAVSFGLIGIYRSKVAQSKRLRCVESRPGNRTLSFVGLEYEGLKPRLIGQKHFEIRLSKFEINQFGEFDQITVGSTRFEPECEMCQSPQNDELPATMNIEPFLVDCHQFARLTNDKIRGQEVNRKAGT